jgi:hypothetical protein
MCCKLLDIDEPELKKPGGAWCSHCRPGQGCGIYDTRPNVCRGFACELLINPDLSDPWKPSRSKIVVRRAKDSRGYETVHFIVDPAVPGRWREPPYLAVIKQAAASVLEADGGRFVTYVKTGGRSILILPHKEVDATRTVVLVVRAGDSWEACLFETEDEAQRYVTRTTQFLDAFRVLPSEQRDQIRAALATLVKGMRS